MIRKKYSAAILMTIVAIVCLAIHFFTGWRAAMNDSAMHQQPAEFNQYVVEWVRDTFENLQSEFWQLAVQFALLAGLFEAIRVHTYEEDEEELKQRLDRIEALLQERAGHS